MKTKTRYHWGKDFLLINLGNRIEPRVRMLFLIEFIVTSGMATIFLLQATRMPDNTANALLNLGAALLYLTAAYRLLNRLFYREKLIISNTHFTIVRKSPFSKNVANYDWKSMGALHYIGKDIKTDHPLKGNCFDYFGFDTQEHLIQDLHHDGNLYFKYKDTSVRFARGIYSWHAEEIIRMIRLYSGTALQLGEEWKYMLEEEE